MGCILLHLNFVKTRDEIKSQHENSTTQGEKKGTPTDFLTNKICCHRSFTTTFGLAFTPPSLACLLAAHLLHYINPSE
jgi:hypothetical protein